MEVMQRLAWLYSDGDRRTIDGVKLSVFKIHFRTYNITGLSRKSFKLIYLIRLIN